MSFMIINTLLVGEMIAGGLREATQGLSDSVRSSLLGCVLSLLFSILQQPVVVRPVVAQQCLNCLVIMPVSDNGSCIFTFPFTHPFFTPLSLRCGLLSNSLESGGVDCWLQAGL